MTATASPPVTLPSINEMFPEHMMRTSMPRVATALRHQPRYPVVPLPPSVISFPARSQKRTTTTVDAYSSGEDHDAERGSADNTKRHVCPTCSKRFNRPSSLKIHVNTHTGATPFRCPFPNCGREFNVNSNMRRHLRNHSATASSSSSSSSRSPIERRRRPESDGVLSFGVDIPPAMSSSSSSSSVPRGYYPTSTMPFAYNIPPPPPQSTTSSPVSEEDSDYPESNSDSEEETPRPVVASGSFRLGPVRSFSTRAAVSDERGRYGPYPPVVVPRLIK